MSVQSNKVLRNIRHAQKAEGEIVFVNYEDCKFMSIVEGNEISKEKEFTYPLSTIRSILKELEDQNLLEKLDDDYEYIRVTHIGNHTTQTFLRNLFHFLCNSILVPIVVALLTSILFNLLLYFFPDFFKTFA